ncbi:MAG: SDR family oxidoreductase [Clostridia bacterium]|nr:SDR family oxidoreductase [Clostridia bacterium]
MKTVLITGASRGIGEACARIFGEKGWKVYLNCRSNVDMLKDLQRDIPESVLLPFDVSDKKAVQENLKDLQIDCLVNNAGVALFSPFDAVTSEQESALYGVNLFGALNCTRALLPQMIRRKSGCIINLSSMWGETGGSCEVDYSAAKGALIAFTKALSKEVGPSDIRVNCVCPGVIDTDMNAHLSIADVNALVEEIPLERLGNAEDVAEAVYFLASEKASYITGAVLDVNGGIV